jgi:hypothetical protein
MSGCAIVREPFAVAPFSGPHHLQYKAKAVPLHTTEVLGENDVLILDLGTRWGLRVSFTLRPRFSPGKRAPSTLWTGGWVRPRAGLDTVATGKIFLPLPGIEPRSPDGAARRQTD